MLPDSEREGLCRLEGRDLASPAPWGLPRHRNTPLTYPSASGTQSSSASPAISPDSGLAP